MDNSSLNATEIAVGSLLARGNNGGGGGGAWGSNNGFLQAEAIANGTATKEAIDNNNNSIRDLGMDFENATRDRQVTDIQKSIADAEFRGQDRSRDIERLINQSAKDAAECCCEAKLQNCKDHAELQALVIKENSNTRELIRGDALAAANAKITQLETINALNDNGHGRGH